eukprot:UN01159
MNIRHVERKRTNISGPHANSPNMCDISGFDMPISKSWIFGLDGIGRIFC